MAGSPSDPAGASREPGAAARVVGTFFSPVKTLESVARRPGWVLPLLLWTLASIAVAMVVGPRIDYERLTREAMEKRGQTIPPAQLEQAIATQKRIGPMIGMIAATVVPTIISLIVTAVLFGAFHAFGHELKFRQAFGETAHAFLPGVLGALLLIPVILSRQNVDPSALGDLLRSNLGFLVDAKSAPALHSILQSIDVFSFWSAALLVVGFAAAARASRGRAATIIVTLLVLFVLGKAGVVALFGRGRS